MIEVLTNGALNLIVDTGRTAATQMGVSKGGAMDTLAMRLANLMVGNEESDACIEVTIFPFRARFDCDTRIAIAGAACNARIGDQRVSPYWCRTIRSGETLALEAPSDGARVYIAVCGGIDVPVVLGSRTTDIRSGFGGVEGRALKRGDRLAVGEPRSGDSGTTGVRKGFGVSPASVKGLFRELRANVVEVRCLRGSEYEGFQRQSQVALCETPYTVTADSNRMGYRLAGEGLHLHTSIELLSHGIVPGTVQVPPSGQPIIQLADGNTCGGYPKIATVIEPDLWKLGQVRAGIALRFTVVEIEQALEQCHKHHRELTAISENLELIVGCH
ncbi:MULTISPECIES: biotin-dependent carboxyltransferase family protein [unclassified Cupriavidus]|uniref:5-oxoprolinase subunit C family protein n=1 Tax=unclassified Cupriavidus TaxID=2640874 RepID=UPI001C008F36|nr:MULTISPECIES: biotin-dependent carboxyltransferase family protein [unclassified Cupriavidus]MCA3187690.1 biotin-dependent carboxyltransferase family protein [Cupriavidus sp.]MCA3189119.1 biotin-dependent carboxyltransferase family protein [Cupriavidus sp.]MCA3198839.1 biotin-dependent carboxyltransferase family protein [Cupriavidus sp.]MCA3201583.1 biotin-dependent carboxyltransferase family protein [Cupriavidus sp.]MCA3230874.1 biotin-dependent carboxyltransferase family protein [Cupriavid